MQENPYLSGAYHAGIAGQIEPKFTTDHLKKIITDMQEGLCIRFHHKSMDEDGHFKFVDIYGAVVKKYPHIFLLDDGHYYTYVDYMLGKVI